MVVEGLWYWAILGFGIAVILDYAAWMYRMLAVMLSTLLGR